MMLELLEVLIGMRPVSAGRLSDLPTLFYELTATDTKGAWYA